jgi:hypothetical protein
MPRITITDAAYWALSKHTKPGFRLGPYTREPNGGWTLEISDRWLAQIAALSLPGESQSDTLIRLSMLHNQGGYQ